MSVTDREVGRRKVLQFLGAGVAAATFAGIGGVGFLDREVLDRPTSEQVKAKKLLDTLDDSYFKTDLTVTGDITDVGNRAANFRDKPRVASDKGDLEAGEREGSLEIGSRINRWIAVVGNDKDMPMDSRQTDRWVAFEKGDRAYFAHKSLFDNLTAIEEAELFDLSKLR